MTAIAEADPRPRKAATELDTILGARLKMARQDADMSQGELGERIGVTFQQIQKYEKGVNRMTLTTSLHICEALGIQLHTLLPEGFHPLLGLPIPRRPRRPARPRKT